MSTLRALLQFAFDTGCSVSIDFTNCTILLDSCFNNAKYYKIQKFMTESRVTFVTHEKDMCVKLSLTDEDMLP